MPEVPTISTACKSEKGRRPENEDVGLALGSADLGGKLDALLIVADGMGGRASGATASSTALNAVRDFVLGERVLDDPSAVLDKGLRAANEAVYRLASTKPELQGMGTTCVAAALKGNTAHFAYMGDSRAYLLRDGELKQLTEDHSFVAERVRSGDITAEQARTSRFRNVITKAVGLDPKAVPDTGSAELRSGDVLLLCTDGLTTAARDSEIADVMCTSSDPDEACSRLIDLALKQGSRDNITVVMASYGTPVRKAPVRTATVAETPAKGSSVSRFFTTLLLLILGAAIGFYGPHLYQLVYRQKSDVSTSAAETVSTVRYEDPAILLSYIPLQGRFLSLGPGGSLYVVDNRGMLLKVNRSGEVDSSYPARETFSVPREASEPFMSSDNQGNLYISHPAGKKIQKFDASGNFLMDIAADKLESPEALAVAENGDIFIIDAGRLKVLRAKAFPESTP